MKLIYLVVLCGLIIVLACCALVTTLLNWIDLRFRHKGDPKAKERADWKDS